MKINIRLVAFFLLFFTFCNKAVSENLLTEKQVQKMAVAAWKEPVRSIDVTLYKEITTPPMSEDEFSKMFEDSFEKTEGPKENLPPAELEQRNRTIQKNVENSVKEQEAGRKIKQRIRIDGFRQRIDDVLAWPKVILLEGTPHESIKPEVVLGPNTPYEITYVNSGDKRKGDYTSFRYFHKLKSAQITNDEKSTWAGNDFIKFARLSSFFQGLLGVNKGTFTEPVFVPDPNKIENLRKTGLLVDDIRLVISPDPNNPNTRDCIEIKNPNSLGRNIMICDKADYSHVYYMESCIPTTGKILYVMECNNFDSQDFPHYIKEIQYDLNGDLKEKSVYRIEKVELNPVIPDEVFAFNPPEDYDVADRRLGSGYDEKIKKETETFERLNNLGKVSDIPELKKLLKHESWKVRWQALLIIGSLPIEDPNVLRDIAISMQDDKRIEVRKEADRILQRIESNK